MSSWPPSDRVNTLIEPDTLADVPVPRLRPRRRVRGVIMAACWLYAAFLLGIWAIFKFQGDDWWIATLLMCGPRWAWAAPLVLLVPAAILGCRRGLWVLAGCALLAVFPIMDLRVPWRVWTRPAHPGPVLRVLTCNVHLSSLNPEALRKFIAESNPQVVALQESSAALQSKIFVDGVWYIDKDGEFCVASRYPVRKVQAVGQQKWLGGLPAFAFEIESPFGVVPFLDVHFISPHLPFRMTLHHSPTGPAEIERNSAQRLDQAREVLQYANSIGSPLILAGDFNTPADSPIYNVTLSNLSNAFQDAGSGFGWTYYAKVPITRIDHVLTGGDWQCRRCWVGPNIGSPHHPLVADLQWVGKVLKPVPVGRIAATRSTIDEPPVEPPSSSRTLPRPRPTGTAVSGPIGKAIEEHRLALGMTMDQAKEALDEWRGPTVQQQLPHGWTSYLWTKGEERVIASFDPSGQLRSLQN